MKHTKLKNLTLQILINLSVLLFLILLSEVFFRFFYQYHSFFPRYTFEKAEGHDYHFTPSKSYKMKTLDYTYEFSINEHHFRDKMLSPKKTPNQKRIFSIGDSMTFGQGVMLDKTFTKQFEHLLNQDSSETSYEVINGGVPGYGTQQAINLYKVKGELFKPDIVLLNFYIGNDFQNNSGSLRYIIKDGYFVFQKNATHVSPIRKSVRFLRLHSKFFSFVFSEFERFLIFFKYKIDEKSKAYRLDLLKKERPASIEADILMTVDMIAAFHKYLQEKGIPLVVSLIPSQLQIKSALFDELLNAYGIEDREQFAPKMINDFFIEKLNEKAIPTIDLYGRFQSENDKEELYFLYDSHLTERGHTVTAEGLFQGFKKEGFLRKNEVIR